MGDVSWLLVSSVAGPIQPLRTSTHSSDTMADAFLLLLCVFVPLAFPHAFVSGDSTDDLKALKVSISQHPPVQAVLAGNILIPCSIMYLRPLPTSSTAGRRAVLGAPRVKWTFISDGREVEILVARGNRVKVNEDYRFRASLPTFQHQRTNASLLLRELRPSDSGIYRCDVQHGIDDGHDLLEVKVKGVVFHYREGSQRYAYTFAEAQEACARVGARIATPEQLYAAYLGGYEQCDAGWIADQTVRYPIHTPREACYGDMNGFPGVRNYGVVDPEDTYDVYCYAEELHGEIFLETAPDKFTWQEAEAHCQALGAEIATTGQLYAAWTQGLDHCSPGWLADGSVRYPIITPRERCGGSVPGVKTIFLFRNQTGFPDAQSRYDVFCFREEPSSFTEVPENHQASEPRGLQDIVTVTERMEELQLPQAEVDNESRGAIYSVPFFQDAEREKPSSAPEEASVPVPRHAPLDNSVSSDLGLHLPPATPSPETPFTSKAELGGPISCGAQPGSSAWPGEKGRGGNCTEASQERPRTGEEHGADQGHPGSLSEGETARASKDDGTLALDGGLQNPVRPTEAPTAGSVTTAPTLSPAAVSPSLRDESQRSGLPGPALASPATSQEHGEEAAAEGSSLDITHVPEVSGEADFFPGSKHGEGDSLPEDHPTPASEGAVGGKWDVSERLAPNTSAGSGQDLLGLANSTIAASTLLWKASEPGQEEPAWTHATPQQGLVSGLTSTHFPSLGGPPGAPEETELSGDASAGTTVSPATLQSVSPSLREPGKEQRGTVGAPSPGSQPGTAEPKVTTVPAGHLGADQGPPSKELSGESDTQAVARETVAVQPPSAASPSATPGGETKGDGPPTSPEHGLVPEAASGSMLEGMPFTDAPLTTAHPLPVLPTERASLGVGVNISEDCIPNPCLNGGTCSEEEVGISCVCLPGYGGHTCETDLQKCGPGWDSFQGSCYKHFSTRRSWEDAEMQCRHYGGHLANILTPEEQNFINNQYREYQWIGLNDRTIEGDFQWSDGSPLLYENWHPGQPDSYFLSGENCVVIVWHDGGQWSDVPCNYHLSYTCKMGLVSCSSPPEVTNARMFGKPKQRYEISSIVRYRCLEGFTQRHSPIIRCQEEGMWEHPQLACLPSATQTPED
ncbi:PREDICTED: brevican core protein isoform X1 [Gavialis gangeticus]|uniref:brevican core protein isoform X1 n=2 Tax=Gavialis gangeticus TaxID=94835 RepID=UPI00092E681C|nr:PREDICTED: brevican core protein isoform X1 [Gavialis gangeticus]